MANRNERVFNCPDCGVEVITKYSGTLRCKECARKHALECKKRWHRENDHLRNRKKQGAPGETDDTHFCDSPENIQKCLNCKKPKCGNCLGYVYVKKANRRAE